MVSYLEVSIHLQPRGLLYPIESVPKWAAGIRGLEELVALASLGKPEKESPTDQRPNQDKVAAKTMPMQVGNPGNPGSTDPRLTIPS